VATVKRRLILPSVFEVEEANLFSRIRFEGSQFSYQGFDAGPGTLQKIFNDYSSQL
jgi:hypothetical protein